ncbi:MAG: hypothetical protein MJ237_03685 [bacterium]|nr:hypothetical protein [bacterium]
MLINSCITDIQKRNSYTRKSGRFAVRPCCYSNNSIKTFDNSIIIKKNSNGDTLYFHKTNNNFSNEYLKISKNTSFKGIPLTSKKLYSEFLKEYKKAYGTIPLEDTVASVINTGVELAHGREKQIFKIPKMPEYLIGYLYDNPHDKKDKINETPLVFCEYNFGQPFATNGSDIIIKKYIAGEPHLVSDFLQVINYITKNDKVTREMALEYSDKLRLIKAFPQDAYNDLAKQLEYLYENNQPIDSVNSSNLLVDYENKKFNLIDVLDSLNKYKPFADKHKGQEKDRISVYDMITLLIDMKFQPYYLDQLNANEQQEIITISKDIINKCINATIPTKLSKKDDLMCAFFKYLISIFPDLNENFVKRYPECKALYKDELNF